MKTERKGIYLVQSLVAAYIVTGIILCILAFLMYQTSAGIKIANIGVTVTYILASVFAGFIVGHKMGQRKFIWGFIVGLLYFLILLAISMFFYQNVVLISRERITALLLCAAGGTLGGMFA